MSEEKEKDFILYYYRNTDEIVFLTTCRARDVAEALRKLGGFLSAGTVKNKGMLVKPPENPPEWYDPSGESLLAKKSWQEMKNSSIYLKAASLTLE
ncbi:hypothetical protein ACFL29_01530 [Patescibacteria group bacterium]